MIINLMQHFVKTIQFSSNMSLFRQKLRLFEFHFENIQLKFIMNSIKSFSQNTDAETFIMNVFDTFFIIVHDDTQTETEKAVMIEYH